MSEIKIDKGVAVAPIRRRGKPFYPWADMARGDSFFVPGKTTDQMSPTVVSHRKRHGGKYVTRAVTENGVKGVRVWRVE